MRTNVGGEAGEQKCQRLRIDAAAVGALQEILFKETGVVLKKDSEEMILSRLGQRLKRLEIDSFGQYIAYVNQHYFKEVNFLVDALTTHETYFFREASHFDYAIGEIRRQRKRDVKIWSAAASYGHEAFTMALLLAEYSSFGTWQIYGTDVSPSSIERARRATYNQQDKNKIPDNLFDLFCVDKGDGTFTFRDTLLQRTIFEVFNLLTPYKSNFFDFVFLRNVLIYFNKGHQDKVIEHCLRALKAGGFLILGHSEKMAARGFALEALSGGIYRKL